MNEEDEHAAREEDEGYSGPASLVLDDAEIPVTVTLRGGFQPIDGYYHWYGRLTGSAELGTLLGGKKTVAVLRTPQGSAEGHLGDPDPWQRYRITGRSTPPFAVDGGVTGG